VTLRDPGADDRGCWSSRKWEDQLVSGDPFGVDAFNIDDRCAQILGSYRAIFVATDSIDENIARIVQRAQGGGHGASEREVRAIHEASLANLGTAIDAFRARRRLRLDCPMVDTTAGCYVAQWSDRPCRHQSELARGCALDARILTSFTRQGRRQSCGSVATTAVSRSRADGALLSYHPTAIDSSNGTTTRQPREFAGQEIRVAGPRNHGKGSELTGAFHF